MDPIASVHKMLCKSRERSKAETLAMIAQAWAVQGKSKLTETKKDEPDEEQSEERAHNFLLHSGDYSQRIRPGRPNSQFLILMWRF
jgi:hypothetical protein